MVFLVLVFSAHFLHIFCTSCTLNPSHVNTHRRRKMKRKQSSDNDGRKRSKRDYTPLFVEESRAFLRNNFFSPVCLSKVEDDSDIQVFRAKKWGYTIGETRIFSFLSDPVRTSAKESLEWWKHRERPVKPPYRTICYTPCLGQIRSTNCAWTCCVHSSPRTH